MPPDAREGNADELSRSLARLALGAASLIGRWGFRAEVHGLERIPRRGGALLVGNHAFLGIDSVALFGEIYRRLGRVPRGLGWRPLFQVPGLRLLLRRIGAVPGGRERGIGLLERGELVVSYPGGALDSFKGPGDRYRLFWNGRFGFAAVAVEARAPIIPIAAIGPDDAFLIIGREPFLGRWLHGGDARYDFPVPLCPLPRLVKFDYYVGEPIMPGVPPERAGDPAALAALQARVRRVLEDLIDEGLARRARGAG